MFGSRSNDFCSIFPQPVDYYAIASIVSLRACAMSHFYAKSVLTCAHASASRLSSVSMVFWVGRRSPSVKMPFLIFFRSDYDEKMGIFVCIFS